MSRIMQYAHRILACFYLLLFTLLTTATIGKHMEGSPMTWGGAWRAMAVLAVGVWLGWQAGRESKGPKP